MDHQTRPRDFRTLAMENDCAKWMKAHGFCSGTASALWFAAKTTSQCTLLSSPDRICFDFRTTRKMEVTCVKLGELNTRSVFGSASWAMVTSAANPYAANRVRNARPT